MPRVYNPAEYLRRVRKLNRDLNKIFQKPMRVNQKRLRDALISQYWQVPFGARIWQWYRDNKGVKQNPGVRLGSRRRPELARWSASMRSFIAKVTIQGVAADMELGGGRLRRHVFWGRGVREPGLEVPRSPKAERFFEKYWQWTNPEIVREFDKFAKRTLNG